MKLIQFFDKLEDHKIYYKPNQGNGGDARHNFLQRTGVLR